MVVDDKKKLNSVDTVNEDAANNDQLDAWTAHKTEAGIIYYYNAVTGESTYHKPSGFKGEVLIHRTCILGRSYTLLCLASLNNFFIKLIIISIITKILQYTLYYQYIIFNYCR